MKTTERVPIHRVQSGRLESLDDTLVVEQEVSIALGGADHKEKSEGATQAQHLAEAQRETVLRVLI